MVNLSTRDRHPRGPSQGRARTAGCLVATLMVALTLARADVRVGDPFPVLSAADLVGSPPPPTAGKVVLVDFWASWCAPCRASFPAYAKLDDRMAEKGLVIVAVSVDDDPAAYRSFVSKWAPPFYTALDAHHQLVSRVGVPSMPTSFLLDRSGRVRWMSVGYHGSSTDKALQSEIETLLNEKTP